MSNHFIPLSIPNLAGKELEYVSETIETGWVSSVGSYVDRFEEEFAKKIGREYAVATVNGTSALHVSLILAGVQKGDEVLVPNLTFVAPANAVKYCHAHPVFMDVEWDSFGMDPDKLESFLKEECTFKNGVTYDNKTKAPIKAIIPVHLNGFPLKAKAIQELCEAYNIMVIEDASESLGSELDGIQTGNFGTLSCFSFNGNKIITSGGGGMIVTDNKELAERAKHLSTTAKADPVEYYHDEVGYNYRLVNVLAALGLAQLEQLDGFVEAKRKNFEQYQDLLSNLSNVHIKKEAAGTRSNYWLYCLVHETPLEEAFGDIAKFFSERKVQIRPLWQLMDMLPMFREERSYHCETSRKVHERVINIPSSTSLSYEEQERVVGAINEYFG